MLSRSLPPLLLLTLCSLAQQAMIVHVRGHITDAATHKAVAGVSISSVKARHDATTDVNGFFSLDLRDGMNPGDEVRIHIEKDGYRADDVTEAASESVTYPIQLTAHRTPSLGALPKQQAVTSSDSAPPAVTVKESIQGQQSTKPATKESEGSATPKTPLKHTEESKPAPDPCESVGIKLPVVAETFPPAPEGEELPHKDGGYILGAVTNLTSQNNCGVATIARGGYVEDSKFIDTIGAGNTIENEGRMERTLVQGSKNVVKNKPSVKCVTPP